MSLTAQQPEVNIVRTAIEALAGVLGGTQSLHTNSMDETLALPTQKAARIALRTQQVIANETRVTNVADPLGGSYFVEALTDEIERQAEELFATIDAFGNGSMLDGAVHGVEEGWFQGEIAQAAYDLERKLNDGRHVVVGVNQFLEGNDEPQPETLYIDREVEHFQVKRLDAVKRARDAATVDAVLARLRAEAADPEVNLMPVLMDASRASATLGEMMGAMADVFGRWEETGAILMSDLFDDYLEPKGRVLVAKLGLDGHDRGVKVVARILRDAGFEVIYTGLRQTPATVVAAAVDEDVDAIGLSMLSGAHLALVPPVVELLRAQQLTIPVVVGGIIPERDVDTLMQAGVAAILAPGASADEVVASMERVNRRRTGALGGRAVGRPTRAVLTSALGPAPPDVVHVEEVVAHERDDEPVPSCSTRVAPVPRTSRPHPLAWRNWKTATWITTPSPDTTQNRMNPVSSWRRRYRRSQKVK